MSPTQNKSGIRALVPSLILAVGILGSTLAAVQLAPTMTNMLGTAALFCVGVLFAAAVQQKIRRGVWSVPLSAFIVTGGLMAAFAIIAWKDPAGVVEMLPVLGACSIATLGSSCSLALSRQVQSSA